jgi:hypothetical protein
MVIDMKQTSSDPRNAIREALRESYLHRKAQDCVCAICGSSDRELAFHVLEKSVQEGADLPDGFVPMSVSMGFVKGSFPVCSKCAPPCSSCKLPIDSPVARRFGVSVDARLGVGYCRDHIHWRYVLPALVSKLFKKS